MNLLIVNDAVVEVQTMQDNIPWPTYGIERVYTAFCVEDARDTIRQKPVDVLLCDIEMPGENGIALIRWIRTHNTNMGTEFLKRKPESAHFILTRAPDGSDPNRDLRSDKGEFFVA